MGGVTFCTWARLRFMAGSCITVHGERFIVRCNLMDALDSAVLYHGPGDLYPSLCACSASLLCLCPSLNLPRQLPTLYFSVLMFAHILDHCIFSARWKDRTKRVTFGVVAFLIVANFWWFRGVAWGIEGPVDEHWGLLWRNVRFFFRLAFGADRFWDRHGTFIIEGARCG